jgi:translation initiation factor 3 subunit A
VIFTIVELIAVGQQSAALEVLHDVVTSKRMRTVAVNTMEPVMLKFTELCVEQRESKKFKEGLYQFKNFAQSTNTNVIEVSNS